MCIFDLHEHRKFDYVSQPDLGHTSLWENLIKLWRDESPMSPVEILEVDSLE